MDARVAELTQDFARYVDDFRREELFTGPSLYFHLRTLDVLHSHPDPISAISDRSFVELLYATLTAWGMHRMGPGGAKLVEFEIFQNGLHVVTRQLQEIQTLRLADIAPIDLPGVTDHVWQTLNRLTVGTGNTKLVAGSKTLHHLLPELVPPIDREYTLRFFFHHKTLNQGDEVAFKEMFPRFAKVASACREQIELVRGHGMNTSSTKTIDNAIVGYVRQHLRSDRPAIEGEPT